MAFVAIRRCYHEKRFYQPGQEYMGEPGTMPRHFVKKEMFSRAAIEKARKEDQAKKVKVRPQKASEMDGAGGRKL